MPADAVGQKIKSMCSSAVSAVSSIFSGQSKEYEQLNQDEEKEHHDQSVCGAIRFFLFLSLYKRWCGL